MTNRFYPPAGEEWNVRDRARGPIAEVRRDLIESFDAVEASLASSGDTIHVSPNGDDEDSGSAVYPLKTLAGAVAAAATLNAADPETIVYISVAQGDYAEDIVLEDLNLTRISIVSELKGSAIFQALLSTANNRNLKTLHLDGLKFTENSEISADTDGETNLLLGDITTTVSKISNTEFQGLIVSGARFVYLYDSQVKYRFENINSRVSFNRSNISNLFTTTWDNDGNKPGGATAYTYTFLSARSSSVYSPIVKRIGTPGGEAILSLNDKSGCANVGDLLVTDGAKIILDGGSSIQVDSAFDQIQAGATLEISDGFFPDLRDCTIDDNATLIFYYENAWNTLHVNSKNGHDKFPGTENYPFQTVYGALEHAAVLNATLPTRTVDIVLEPGYHGNIYLENLELTRISIRARSIGTVTATNIRSESDNRNLEFLYIQGIICSGNITIVADTDGATNLLMSETGPYSMFSECECQNMTIGAAGFLKLRECQVDGAFVNTNSRVIISTSFLGGTFTTTWDQDGNKPGTSTSNYTSINDCSCTNNPTVQRVGTAGGSTSLSMNNGSLCGTGGNVLVTADAKLTLASGSMIYGGGSDELESGATLEIRDGSISNLAAWTIDAGATITFPLQNMSEKITLSETTTPTATTNFGAIYTKNDNKLYFQDGAGVEHEISLVP